ncbi:MAG TPA: hypothetical protein VIF09_12335, partial [Polyangiaceae bacterium]
MRLSPLLLAVLAGILPSCAASAPRPVPVVSGPTDPTTDAELRQSLSGPQRTGPERARDIYRHPLETLELFGLRDSMTVVELSPGGGWYTAVLAPVLRDHGKLFVAGGDPDGDPKSEGTRDAQELQARFRAQPQAFDRVVGVVVRQPVVLGPPESADMVLTFRNFHNWVGDPFQGQVLAAAFAVLKHGGTFGLTDHRAAPGTPLDPKVVDRTGYVPEDAVIASVQKAGFQLAGKSEVNANPRDTRDYPKGVWTLPPSYT